MAGQKVHRTVNQNLELSALDLRETVVLVKMEEEVLEALGVNEKLVARGNFRENWFGEPLHYMVGAV